MDKKYIDELNKKINRLSLMGIIDTTLFLIIFKIIFNLDLFDKVPLLRLIMIVPIIIFIFVSNKKRKESRQLLKQLKELQIKDKKDT